MISGGQRDFGASCPCVTHPQRPRSCREHKFLTKDVLAWFTSRTKRQQTVDLSESTPSHLHGSLALLLCRHHNWPNQRSALLPDLLRRERCFRTVPRRDVRWTKSLSFESSYCSGWHLCCTASIVYGGLLAVWLFASLPCFYEAVWACGDSCAFSMAASGKTLTPLSLLSAELLLLPLLAIFQCYFYC